MSTESKIEYTQIPRYHPSFQRIESAASMTIPHDFSFTSVDIHIYKRRWAMLIMYIIYSALSSMHWMQYTIIANIITRYYNISEMTVDWTSMIFMAAYIVLVIPVSWYVDQHSLRSTILIGAVGTAIGSWVKVASISRDRFIITFIGQTILAFAQVFIHNVPSKLGAVWFAPEQESTACCMAVFGHQLGIAIGFLLTPIIVRNHENSDFIGRDLTIIYYGLAGVTTIVTIVVIIFFESEPKKPPSHAQAIQRFLLKSNIALWPTIKRLMLQHKGYALLLLTFGMNAGAYSAISTLLNQLVLHHYPDAQEDAGMIGLTMVVFGMLGSIFYGYVLDQTLMFRDLAVFVYGLSALGMAAFTAALPSGSMRLLYIASAFLGLCMNGYPAVGAELASELTFPEPEGVVTGLLFAITQVFGIIFTLGVTWVQSVMNDSWANVFCIVILMVGTILTSCITPSIKRSMAHEELAHVAKAIEEEELGLYVL